MGYWEAIWIPAAVFGTLFLIVLVAGFATKEDSRAEELVGNILFGITAGGSLFLFIGVVLFIGLNVDRHSCEETGQLAEINVRYDLPAGCFVEVDGKLIPHDRWVKNTGN